MRAAVLRAGIYYVHVVPLQACKHILNIVTGIRLSTAAVSKPMQLARFGVKNKGLAERPRLRTRSKRGQTKGDAFNSSQQQR